jgi:hypothetical protein
MEAGRNGATDARAAPVTTHVLFFNLCMMFSKIESSRRITPLVYAFPL